MGPIIEVSKLDAARRPIETAILLYFHRRDPVSIHTLMAAAYNVLRDVSAKHGAEPMIFKDRFLEDVRDEYKKEIRQKMNEAENFFKHADRDPDELLTFRPPLSELMLWDCCRQYELLTGETLPYMKTYTAWFHLTHSTLFHLSPEEQALNISAQATLATMNRLQFLQLTPPAMSKLLG